MTATLFQDPLATTLAPATKAPASVPGAIAATFIAPTTTIDGDIHSKLIRKAQQAHAEAAKNELADELAAALAGTKPLRVR
jgi:hypothetical protein